MSYQIHTPPLAQADAEAFGKWLGQYAITLTGLLVEHFRADGSHVVDRPLADTVKQTAAEAVAATPGSAVAGSLLAGFVAPWLLPVSLLAFVATLRASYNNRKRMIGGGHADIQSSRITFGLGNVSAARLQWTEYLMCIYVAHHGWTLRGLHYPRQLAVGQRYAATHTGYPPPWGSRDRPAPQKARRSNALRRIARIF